MSIKENITLIIGITIFLLLTEFRSLLWTL